MKTWNGSGKIGITVIAKNVSPRIRVGKYHIRLDEPNTIGVEIKNPRSAFLESVRKIKDANPEQINKIKNFIIKFLYFFLNSHKQNGQIITIHIPA